MSGYRRSWAGRAARSVAVLLLLVAGAQAQERGSTARADVVLQAVSLLGTPYRFGGASPEAGFDCSGLVRHVFASVLNANLPRRSEEISAVGQPVARGELQPGDLVFFDTLRRAFSHVAIYIGEGRFIHAPAKSGRVRIEGLDDRYWATRFNGARRVIEPQGSVTMPDPSAAVDRSGSALGPEASPPVEREPGP
jgi:hypothetical protein